MHMEQNNAEASKFCLSGPTPNFSLIYSTKYITKCDAETEKALKKYKMTWHKLYILLFSFIVHASKMALIYDSKEQSH